MPTRVTSARAGLCVLLAIAAISQGHARTQRGGCEGEAAVAWDRVSDEEDGRHNLDRWCASVGTPVVQSLPAADADVGRVVVLTWNVHVGAARLIELIARLRVDSASPDAGDLGFVLLLQEAVREGGDIPDELPDHFDPPDAISHARPFGDVVHVARALEMSLAYVPSMRNGALTGAGTREDRGNAILSTEPLGGVTAVELPFGRQRRVAVAATVTPRGGRVAPFVAIAAHMDVFGSRYRQSAHLAGRIHAMAAAGRAVVVGADLNSTEGIDDEAVRNLAGAVPVEARCGTARTFKWYERFDFLFHNLPASTPIECRTLDDRFGSDHSPVVMTIDAVR